MSNCNHTYRTGEYNVLLFDHYGGYLSRLPANNYTSAVLVGEGEVKGNHAASYVINRTIHNSLDHMVQNFEENKDAD